MRTGEGHLLRRPALAGLCVLALALAGGACGEDDSPAPAPSAPSPDTPTSSPPSEPPGDGGAGELPEFPDNDDPSAVVCTGPPEGTFDATSIVGETEEDAAAAAEAEGCSIRVVERDGRALAVTEDFSPSRINVAVSDGIVEEIVNLG